MCAATNMLSKDISRDLLHKAVQKTFAWCIIVSSMQQMKKTPSSSIRTNKILLFVPLPWRSCKNLFPLVKFFKECQTLVIRIRLISHQEKTWQIPISFSRSITSYSRELKKEELVMIFFMLASECWEILRMRQKAFYFSCWHLQLNSTIDEEGKSWCPTKELFQT